jgi:hypothetical protein
MLPGTNLARSIARSGVDWICVDTEHGNISDSEMHEAVTAIALSGVSPLVRIASNEAWMVKRKSFTLLSPFPCIKTLTQVSLQPQPQPPKKTYIIQGKS